MNVTRAAAVALIAFSGVAVPSAGAAYADGDTLLCGLLTPCDDSTGDDGGEQGDTTPVDVDADVDLDLAGDVGADADLELFPDDGTLLVADADITSAALQTSVLGHTVDPDADAVLDTDATVGQGVVVTASGAADATSDVNAAGQRLVGANAANRFCGVQVVVAATSSSNCGPTASNVIGGSDGLIPVVESVDVCGAHVVLAGSATTACGDPSASGAPGASPSTVAGAAVTGTACGLSVAVAGESRTSCDSAQEAPVPDAGSNEPGIGASGTGTSTGTSTGNTTTGNSTANIAGAAVGAASSPAAQPSQTGADSDTATGGSDGSGGSLPLTGTSVLLILMLAGIALAAGLAAVRASQFRSV